MSEDAAAPAEAVAVLTARLARGDEDAFREFHERYFPRLLRYLLVVSGGREELAKDALQSTLLRVVRHAQRFEAEEAFWGWLTVLARSALVDEQRKRQRQHSLLERFFQQAAPAPADPEADVRLLRLLEQNLTALPADDRALLEQKYFDHQPVKAIADANGATEKAVESRLVRIRRRLREVILAQLNDENAP